ncbi:hypothetical protein B0A54_00044 [Friedmanniomyces endolithicus]|uniref:ML-like domain-containing protein n=1 Tax=Friedmanniomyces endolithicus TaxID=329885 RepID=A0A4U0VJK5_9PEZI|nr:hypothetical protein LTS09_013771 [Friedmanniomyces endolithicus]TKA49378.1 hypothetical protein B0A54_00044 [Friedmanniomyces endolithicus]
MSALLRRATPALLPVYLYLSFYLAASASLARAAFLNFDNCLDPAIITSNPLQLQWIPLALDAKFQRESPYRLDVTIYGNVSGQQVQGVYPGPNDPSWQNDKDTFGKIQDIGSSGNYSTLLADFKTLQYSAYNAKATKFCPAVVNGTCPLGPYFHANDTDPSTLPAFVISHDFGSAYTFASLAATIRVISGDVGAPDLACVSANITPDLGPTIKGLIKWLPATILIVKGLATLAAAIWSPWGSSDIFRWSSNYGRDEDQLRLVTPGFGDCLQYIQFVTLTGALSLQYPGFYQPAVSQTSWSLLLFNESYVSHGNGTQSLIDGVYKYNGTYGMTAMSQLIGMTSIEDIWACMAIWLLVIAGIVALLCQLGFLIRWIYRTFTNTTEEDLRQKNLPFTLGNMIRLLFNYFILPIVALSLFQLVIAPTSPTSVVVCAVLLLVIMILAAAWILRTIFTTKPRTYLFDDMPTVLLYGPLYNTYSDSAAPFALVPVFITFMRAVALGAVQPSGIGQIIVLAICEVILILTLNGFRPFQNQTSMNAYHTFFAAVRLVAVLLSIAFVTSLGVSESSKGWIGYAILLLHACVLVFGFFLNSLQTIIEVVARSLGVAGDAQTGAIRGSILNLRMLKMRRDTHGGNNGERGRGTRGSMMSDAAILQDGDGGGYGRVSGARSRSLSASSQQLLNQAGGRSGTMGANSAHRLSTFGDFSSVSPGGAELGISPSQVDAEGFVYDNGAATRNGYGNGELADKKEAEVTQHTQTFYRPPRVRRTTLELGTAGAGAVAPGTKTRKSGSGSSDSPYHDSPTADFPSPVVVAAQHNRSESYEPGSFAGYPGRDSSSPAPAYFQSRDENSSENVGGVTSPRPDYAVREVDQYYRGAALSDLPTRKLKTGPADPTGPAASARGWVKRLVVGVGGGGKARGRESGGKGFEVVRSARMPVRGEGGLAPGVRESAVVGGRFGEGTGEEVEMQRSPRMGDERQSGAGEGQFWYLPAGRQGERGQAASGAPMERAASPVEGDVSPVESEDETLKPSNEAPRPFSFGFESPPIAGLGVEQPARQDSGRGAKAVHGLGGVGGADSLRRQSHDTYGNPRPSADTVSDYDRRRSSVGNDESAGGPYRISGAPSLGPIEGLGGLGLDLPSRFGSQRSGRSREDGRRDWLRDADGLDWNHGSQSPRPGTSAQQPTYSTQQQQQQQHALGSRGEEEPDDDAYGHGDVFSGFDSAPSALQAPHHNNNNNNSLAPTTNPAYDNDNYQPSDFLSAPQGGYQLHDRELARPHSFASSVQQQPLQPFRGSG